jgi:hypothetical protein
VHASNPGDAVEEHDAVESVASDSRVFWDMLGVMTSDLSG